MKTQQWLPVPPIEGHFYRFVMVLKKDVQKYIPFSIEKGMYLTFKKYFFKEGSVIIDDYNPAIEWVEMKLVLTPDDNNPSFFGNGGKHLPFDDWELFTLSYHLLEVHQKNE